MEDTYMEHIIGQKAIDLLDSKRVDIINKPRRFESKLFKKKKKITIVTAVYNGESSIPKTIESVINQSIGLKHIQYIIVDDSSTDKTYEIAKSYAEKYKEICYVRLPENTGTPGTPRNIGIELADSKYITFLDSDDWLAENGLEQLYNILEETGDDYVVGKTIKVESESQSVIGEFASVKERRSISPFEVEHFFYHMGPTARMMKLDMLKEHHIRFPEMTFAEDKLFFCDVFFNAAAVSTTTQPIYFVNRTKENSGSLTRTTDVIKKREADLKVIEYIKSKSLPVDQEKVALNRIYEYDIVKTFDSQLFVKSKNKKAFFDILRQAVETTKDLRYDFRLEFKIPLYRAVIDLFMDNRIDDITKLLEWYKKDKNKKYVIKDNLPYYEIPFFEDQYRLIRIPMLARALDSYVTDGIYYQTAEVYGDYLENMNHILIRDRKRYNNDLIVDFNRSGNIITFKLDVESILKLQNSLFTIFIRYNDYTLVNIKRILKNQITYKERKIEFYTTLANNLGLSITNMKNE